MRSAVFLFISALAFVFGAPVHAATPTLTIYTYDSFVSDWGPGPAIQPIFEQQCGCKIEWVALEDGAALLSRLQAEGAATKADIVLGLDTNLMGNAAATGLLAPHGLSLPRLTLPVAWSNDTFVPFDYGYFAFVYDSQFLPKPPQSFAALAAAQASSGQPKMILEDPRTSTPGLGLVLWGKAIFGDKVADIWKKMAPAILTVSKGWSEAYGLFLKGEAPLVLSYTTSPAYHQLVDKTDRYKALYFPEGNYLQVELAAMTAHAANADLARQFLAFLVSPAFQKQIPEKNWMYPVIDIGGDLPQVFRDLPRPAKTLLLSPETVAEKRQAWVREWLDIVSK